MRSEYLQTALDNFGNKLRKLDTDALLISEYNKGYLRKYQRDYNFYRHYYLQLLEAAFQNEKPDLNATFIDYGGGCGILTYLACELGFSNVIYNDIFEQSVADVQIIAKKLGYEPQHFVYGGITELVSYCMQNQIESDYICSFDVLEHIYNLDRWFLELKELPGNWDLCFITSANVYNPRKRRELQRIHHQSEFTGFDKTEGWKEMDSALPYLELRKQMIREKFPDFTSEQLSEIATATRGLAGEDLIEAATEFRQKGSITYIPDHPTNTCDPLTGNWNEHLIDVKKLQQNLSAMNYQSSILNTDYAPSNQSKFNLPKKILNVLISIVPKDFLVLSPMYILKVSKL